MNQSFTFFSLTIKTPNRRQDLGRLFHLPEVKSWKSAMFSNWSCSRILYAFCWLIFLEINLTLQFLCAYITQKLKQNSLNGYAFCMTEINNSTPYKWILIKSQEKTVTDFSFVSGFITFVYMLFLFMFNFLNNFLFLFFISKFIYKNLQ